MNIGNCLHTIKRVCSKRSLYKVICSLDEYREKGQKAQIDEALELVREYYRVYDRSHPKMNWQNSFGYLKTE